MYLLIYKNKRPHRIENLFKIFTDTKNINNSDSTAVAKSADITWLSLSSTQSCLHIELQLLFPLLFLLFYF